MIVKVTGTVFRAASFSAIVEVEQYSDIYPLLNHYHHNGVSEPSMKKGLLSTTKRSSRPTKRFQKNYWRKPNESLCSHDPSCYQKL